MKCRFCGKEILPGYDFCTECGTVLSNEERIALSQSGGEMKPAGYKFNVPQAVSDAAVPEENKPDAYPQASNEEAVEFVSLNEIVDTANDNKEWQLYDEMMRSVIDSYPATLEQKPDESAEADTLENATEEYDEESAAFDTDDNSPEASLEATPDTDEVTPESIVEAESDTDNVATEVAIEEVSDAEAKDDSLPIDYVAEAVNESEDAYAPADAQQNDSFDDIYSGVQIDETADADPSVAAASESDSLADESDRQSGNEEGGTVETITADDLLRMRDEQIKKAELDNEIDKIFDEEYDDYGLTDDEVNRLIRSRKLKNGIIAAAVVVIIAGAAIAGGTLLKNRGVFADTSASSSADTSSSASLTETNTSEETIADTTTTAPTTTAPTTTAPTTTAPTTTAPTTTAPTTTAPTTTAPTTTAPTTTVPTTTAPTTTAPTTTAPTTTAPATTGAPSETTLPATKAPGATVYVAPGEEAPSVILASPRTVKIAADGASLRAAASSSSYRVRSLAGNSSFTVLGYNSSLNWCYGYFSDSGNYYGWISVSSIA